MPSEASSGACPGRTPKEPSLPGRTLSSTCCAASRRSGVTISRSILLGSILHLLRPFEDLFDAADHVERLLRHLVVLAVDDLTEAPDGVLDRHVLPLDAGELLGDEEGLRQEALDLARPRHHQLVVLPQLVDAEDGDDV